MFERFTERARQVVVLAQDEARALKHNYIGTEHILLGLSGAKREGLAARVLESASTSPSKRFAHRSPRIVGQGDEVTDGSDPVHAARSRVCSSSSLREALEASATTTSAPSTSCSASSARTKASPRASCSTSTPMPKRSSTRSSACSPALAAASRGGGVRAPKGKKVKATSTFEAGSTSSAAT